MATTYTGKFKRFNGTDWDIFEIEPVAYVQSGLVFYVAGAGTTGVWTGSNSDISSLYTGLKIAFKIGAAGGAASTTLNLNSFGAKPVLRNTGALTTHLPANTIVYLTYDGTSWIWADYDSNTVVFPTEPLRWTFSSNTTISGVTAGTFRLNNASQNLATQMTIHNTGYDHSINMKTYLDSVPVNSHLYIYGSDGTAYDNSEGSVYKITAITAGTNYVTYTITWVDWIISTDAIDDTDICYFRFVAPTIFRAISDTPVDGASEVAISSNWAFDHAALSGNGGHVPAIGSAGQFLKHDGSWGTPPDTNTWRGIDDTPVDGQTAESISSNWAFDHANSADAHPGYLKDAETAADSAKLNGQSASYYAVAHTHPYISNADISSPVASNYLRYDGSKWYNGTIGALKTDIGIGDGGLTQKNFTTTDKSNLDTLTALLAVNDADAVINTFGEVLAFFDSYAEGGNIATVLATKEPVITKGTTSQYFRGDMSLATFPTTMTPSAHTLESHSNVTGSPVATNYLRHDGTNWYNGTVAAMKTDLGLGTAAYTNSTAYRASTWTPLISDLPTITVAKGGLNKTSITAGAMLYASAADTYAEVTTSAFGRSLLNAVSGTMFANLNADKLDGYDATGLPYRASNWVPALTDVTGADDLKAIEVLSGTSGLLKKTAANTWSLDTNTYLTSLPSHGLTDHSDVTLVTPILTNYLRHDGTKWYNATVATMKTDLGLGSLAYSSATIPTNNNQLTNGAGYISSIGLLRTSVAAPSTIEALTASNFRTTLFGSAANGYQIATARWNTSPTVLGMSSYGTMMAWGASDTQGFIAIDYSSGGGKVKVGGGNADLINWSQFIVLDNDSRLSDARVASDVYAWAKAATKPTYNYTEVGALGLTANAASATKLNTARAINGVNFDGTAAITIYDSTKEPVITKGTTSQYFRGDMSLATFPTIPTNNNQLTNGAGYITAASPTFTGTAVAPTNTTYTTRQIRNVILSTGDPTGGSNGDIWIKYTA